MLKSIKETMGSQDGQQCSYSRRKKEKKAKIKFDDSVNEEPIRNENGIDDQALIDSFVQEVIEKAKAEYLRQCNVVHDEEKQPDVVPRSTSSIEQENGRVVPEQSSKKSNKEKQKRRHHYKYSDPVDEREISEYEQQDSETLLQSNTNTGETKKERKNPTTRNRFYSRTVSTFRRMIGCCFGKT